MNYKFVVKFLIDFWNNEDGLYTVDEIIESKNIDELTDKLENDIEEFTPEQSIPTTSSISELTRSVSAAGKSILFNTGITSNPKSTAV